MDYDELLNLATDMGYGLLLSGAEIYRVEDAIQRLLFAYGVDPADPFVIPNCINLSIVTPDGTTLTRIKNVPPHGNDVDSLDRYNDLCRKLCANTPPLEEAREQLDRITATKRVYSIPVQLFAYYIASAGYAMFFGGNLRDAICSGFCGLAIWLVGYLFSKLPSSNGYLTTIVSAAVSAYCAQCFVFAGLGDDLASIIIGAFMALVPGILFTNSIRDIMAGDMVSGVSKVGDAIFNAVIIALGTALAMAFARITLGV